MINKISKILYKLARLSRWAQAISLAIRTGSLTPILRRIVNVVIGRKIASKLFLKGK